VKGPDVDFDRQREKPERGDSKRGASSAKAREAKRDKPMQSGKDQRTERRDTTDDAKDTSRAMGTLLGGLMDALRATQSKENGGPGWKKNVEGALKPAEEARRLELKEFLLEAARLNAGPINEAGGISTTPGKVLGAVSGLAQMITAHEVNKKIEGSLEATENVLGLSAKLREHLSPALAAGTALEAASTLTAVATLWFHAMTDGGAAIQKGVEKAANEGTLNGYLLGYAVGATYPDRQWVRNNLRIRVSDTGKRAETELWHAFNKNLMKGFDAASQLNDAQKQEYLRRVNEVAAKHGIDFMRSYPSRDEYMSLINGIANTTERYSKEILAD
jgi:hypothetical protein